MIAHEEFLHSRNTPSNQSLQTLRRFPYVAHMIVSTEFLVLVYIHVESSSFKTPRSITIRCFWTPILSSSEGRGYTKYKYGKVK